MSTVAVNLDITQYVRINASYGGLIIQAHRDSVRIAFSDFKPTKANTVFHTLSENADDVEEGYPGIMELVQREVGVTGHVESVMKAPLRVHGRAL